MLNGTTRQAPIPAYRILLLENTMTKSSAPKAVLKSQLEALTGTVKSNVAQSALARFIVGDLKGGEFKHDFAMSMIRAAIEQAYKGNQRDIPEAMALCTGKSAKARAYHAGFHAIADMVKPLTYAGKLADAGNASVREDIANQTQHASCEFEIAYLATVENIKVEATFARKAKAKAKTTPATAAPATAAPVADADTITVDIGTSVDAVVQALDGGLLNADELAALDKAIKAFGARVNAAMDLRDAQAANATPALQAA